MHITGSSLGPAQQNGGKSNSNYAKEIKSVADLREGSGKPATPLIFRPNKIFLETAPPYLRVWMTVPPPPYLKVWIRHVRCF